MISRGCAKKGEGYFRCIRAVAANYAYKDADGHLTAISYPSYTAQNVAMSYDSYGRMSTMTDGTGPYGQASHGRVRRRHCCRPLPSEPDGRVSPHPAQASRTHPGVFGARGQERTGMRRVSLWSGGWASRWSAAVSRPTDSGRAGYARAAR